MWTEKDEAEFSAWKAEFAEHFDPEGEEIYCEGFWCLDGNEEDFISFYVCDKPSAAYVFFDYPAGEEDGKMYMHPGSPVNPEPIAIESIVQNGTDAEAAAEKLLRFLDDAKWWLVDHGRVKLEDESGWDW